MMFEFIKNMWILKRITTDHIETFVTKKYITQAQADEITAMDQITPEGDVL